MDSPIFLSDVVQYWTAIYPELTHHQKVQSTLKPILPQERNRLKETIMRDKGEGKSEGKQNEWNGELVFHRAHSKATASRKKITMADTIKPGTILITEGALLPESLLLESEPYAYGWRLVKKLDSNGLDQIISQAGWNFFYIAGVIETNAFGSDEKKTTRKAIKRIIANLKSKNFNCLEITRVAAKRSLGLPYVSVSARSRHIQEGQALSGE